MPSEAILINLYENFTGHCPAVTVSLRPSGHDLNKGFLTMQDIYFIAFTVVFFVLAIAYTRGCAKL